jgi:hypothetical protein
MLIFAQKLFSPANEYGCFDDRLHGVV